MKIFTRISARRDLRPRYSSHDFSGTRTIIQSNNTVTSVILTQVGHEITGTASYDAGRKGIIRGTVSGKTNRTIDQEAPITGKLYYKDFIVMEIVWNNGGVGQYSGAVSQRDENLKGTAAPKGGNTDSVIKWFTNQRFGEIDQ